MLIQWRFYQNRRRKKCSDIFVNSSNISTTVFKKVIETTNRQQFLGELLLKSIIQRQFWKIVFESEEFWLLSLMPF